MGYLCIFPIKSDCISYFSCISIKILTNGTLVRHWKVTIIMQHCTSNEVIISVVVQFYPWFKF